jgi:uncharacterized protein (DUF1800 family)
MPATIGKHCIFTVIRGIKSAGSLPRTLEGPARASIQSCTSASPPENPNVPFSLLDTPRRRALLLLAALSLAACGGGGGGGGDSSAPPAPEAKPTRAEAGRFLAQASMGPTSTEIDRVVAQGYGGWIDAQLALPATSHRAHWDARDTAIRAATPGSTAGAEQVFESFWKQAVTGEDQLRQRVVWALSQIFVISMADDAVGNNPRAVAAWLDMLGDKGMGTYRELLGSVSRHPMMGTYLSHLRNQKADTRTGRVPDENYAREVMQLFSIGLVQLNEDGSPGLSNGNPIDTYDSADISGMARVFTGWSWACPDWPDNSCFSQGSVAGVSDPDRSFKPMQGYPQHHSTEEKRFLGTTIPAHTVSNPEASLAVALDTLANHPNVGPFIGRQLIQRLVTSNPSPAYVRDVSRVWADNGRGTRGDLKAVVRAILLHPEARSPATDTSGKLREPVLRLAALLRAFDYRSDTGWWRVGNTDNPGTALGQSPMRSPSVFNFYRPGYVAPGTTGAARGLSAPELQIAHETSAAGLVNYLRDAVALGVGASNTLGSVTRRDIQADFSAELALATDPGALVDRVFTRLLPHTAVSAELRSDIVAAVGSIALPTSGSTATALRNRVNTALLLTLVSAEFQVQR